MRTCTHCYHAAKLRHWLVTLKLHSNYITQQLPMPSIKPLEVCKQLRDDSFAIMTTVDILDLKTIHSLRNRYNNNNCDITLRWLNVVLKRDNVCVLKRQSGRVSSGHVVAVLGPSGAGKTTLLNVLTGRSTPTRGHVTITANCDVEDISLSFVQQRDSLIDFFTVSETLLFASRLKNVDHTRQEHNQLINSILATFNLGRLCDTTISRISGGERKRVAICVEAISRPSIMFLDEPTSG